MTVRKDNLVRIERFGAAFVWIKEPVGNTGPGHLYDDYDDDADERYLFSNNASKSWTKESARQRFLKKAAHKKIHIGHISDYNQDYYADKYEKSDGDGNCGDNL